MMKIKKAKENLGVCLRYGYVLKSRQIKKFKIERETKNANK